MFPTEQKQKIGEALTAKTLNPCASCGHLQTWQIGDAPVIFALAESSSLGQLMPSSKGYPCVPLICSNCGNTVFYNVVVLGTADLVGAQVNKVSEVVKQEAGKNAWRTPASATSSKHAFDRIDSIMDYSDSSKDS